MKNIGFTGVFRLILRPLVDELPCFGAVCVSLRHKVIHELLFSSFTFSDLIKLAFWVEHYLSKKLVYC